MREAVNRDVVKSLAPFVTVDAPYSPSEYDCVDCGVVAVAAPNTLCDICERSRDAVEDELRLERDGFDPFEFNGGSWCRQCKHVHR